MPRTRPLLSNLIIASIFGSALVLTGCPAENNDPKVKPDLGVDLGVDLGADMGADQGADMSADMGADMGPPDIACAVVQPSKRAFDVARGQPVSLLLRCAEELSQRGETLEAHVFQPNRAGDEWSETLKDIRCEQADESWECFATLSAILPPIASEDEAIGPWTFRFNVRGVKPAEPGAEHLTFRVHWGLGKERIREVQERADVVPMREGFEARGLGVKTLAMEGSGLIIIDSALSVDGGAVELSASTLTKPAQAPVITVANVAPASLSAQQLVTVRTDTGADAMWWAFDAEAQAFLGASLTFDARGQLTGQRALKGETYAGPRIKRIVDATPALQGKQGAAHGVVFIAAVTEQDTDVVIGLFMGDDGANVAKVYEGDALGSVPAKELTSATSGWLKDPAAPLRVEGGPDEIAAKLPPHRWTHVAVTQEASKSALHVGEKEVILNIGFKSEGAYVGKAGGKLGVLVHGADGARAMFALDHGADGSLSSPVALPLPPSVDLRPSGLSAPITSAIHNARAVAATKREVWGGDQALRLHIADEHVVMLGRWPWNWRDKLKSSAARADQSGMVVSWKAADGNIERVHPLPRTAGELTPRPGSTYVVSMTGGGSGLAVAQGALQADLCTSQPDACVHHLASTRGGFHAWLGAGKSGPTLRTGKYGDILIDGVPLEFDLIGAPIFFDMPEGSGGGAMLISAVNHPTLKDVTHVVWTLGMDGRTSNPGLITIKPDPTLKLDADAIRQISMGGVVPIEGAKLGVVIGLNNTKKDPEVPLDALLESEEGMVIIPTETLVAATTSRSPVAIPIDGSNATITTRSRLAATAQLDTSFGLLLSGSAAARTDDVNTGGHPWLSLDGISYLVARTQGSTCASVVLSALEVQGAPMLTEAITRKGTDDCADQSVVLGVGHFLGDDSEQLLTLTQPSSLTLWTLTREGDKAGAPLRVVERTRKLTTLPHPIDPSRVRLGDFNGDGITDVAIAQSYVDPTEQRAITTTVFLGDGLGGLGNPITLIGGPTVEWSTGTTARASDFNDNPIFHDALGAQQNVIAQ